MERSGDVASSNDCKLFKKNKTLVDGKYALTEGFPLVTYSGELCSQSLTLEVHRNPYDERMEKIRVYRDRYGYSEQATRTLRQAYGENIHITYDPVAIFYIGHFPLDGLVNDPARKALHGATQVVDKECGGVPAEIVVKGILSKPKRKVSARRFAGDPEFEEIYSGTLVDGALQHDDQTTAETYVAWATAEQSRQQNATYQAMLEKEARIQQAREGTVWVFATLLGIYSTSPCNVKELCELYKPTDCVAPPC